jgi:hypothetical protein
MDTIKTFQEVNHDRRLLFGAAPPEIDLKTSGRALCAPTPMQARHHRFRI